MKSLLLQVFEWDIKITGWGDTGSWTISMVSLPTWNSRLEFFFARFWKIITLRVFLEFISNIQELQKEDNVLRQFCNSILDRYIIINSSAYKSEFNLVPFGRMIGSDKVFWNADGKSLTSLGLIVYEDLTYEVHVNELCNKLSKRLALLRHISPYLKKN